MTSSGSRKTYEHDQGRLGRVETFLQDLAKIDEEV